METGGTDRRSAPIVSRAGDSSLIKHLRSVIERQDQEWQVAVNDANNKSQLADAWREDAENVRFQRALLIAFVFALLVFSAGEMWYILTHLTCS